MIIRKYRGIRGYYFTLIQLILLYDVKTIINATNQLVLYNGLQAVKVQVQKCQI